MWLRARTIRLRLTLIYSGVFLGSSGALLTIGYLLVRHSLARRHTFHEEVTGLGRAVYNSLLGGPAAVPNGHVRAAVEAGYHQASNAALHTLLFEYIGVLLLMTAVSVALGWWIAGRALAPLRAITATAKRVSSTNLAERIALRGPEDELKQLADTFDGMLARLDDAFASQRHFVANASHELRTPLAIMRTEVEVVLADPDASVRDLRGMGDAVRETIERSESLIAALLFLARSQGVRVGEETVDLAELAADCVTDLRRRAREARVNVVADLESARARGDPALLERMIANLIENGIRHNVAGGELRVKTSATATSVELNVVNGGSVIDPLQARGLTEPFRRISRSAGGFGLGLSIVRSVAEAHGGVVTLTAPAEGGLDVLVTLPAVRRTGRRDERLMLARAGHSQLTRS